MPAPAVALAGVALRNPRRTGSSLLAVLAALGRLARVPGRRARLDPRPAAAAGRLRPVARRQRRHPAPTTSSSTSRPARATASTPGSSPRSARSRPTTAAPPHPACAPASTPTAAAPARCSSRSSARRAPGTATASTATATAAAPRTTPRTRSPPPPATCKASGAPGDYRRAIFAYNHADWYVADVLAQADVYRGAATSPERLELAGRDARPSASCSPTGASSSRPASAPTCAPAASTRVCSPRSPGSAERHTIIVTALRADHYPGTNHEAGRAMDIGAVDGEICRGGRTGRCAEPGARARRRHRPDALDRAHLLLGPRPRRPGHVRPRRPLRPHPLGHGRMTADPAPMWS